MRKLALVLLLIYCFSLASCTLTDLSSSSPLDEWWMVGSDTGYSRYTSANAPANISVASVNSISLPSDVTASPIIVGDSLFIHPYNYYSAKIYELNALNVSEVLSSSSNSYTLAGRGFSYYNGYLYMHSSGYLYQINASNVSQVLDTENIGDYGYYATTTVYNDSVYVGTGNYNSDIDQFNATNISDVIATYNSYSRIYESTPVLNGYAYGASSSGIRQMNAFDISSYTSSVSCYANSIEYTFPVSSEFVYKKCTDGDGSNTRLTQFNASDVSQIIATYPVAGYDYALGNGYLYFVSGTSVYQMNASNISIQVKNYTLPTSSIYAPVVTDDYLFVGAGNTMYQFDAANVSQLIGTYVAGGSVSGPPVVAKGFLYFGSTDNKLYQLGTYNPLLALNIDYPEEDGVYLNVSDVNYTVSGEISFESCWYSNSSGVWNSSSVSAGINFSEVESLVGWNDWMLYCNDTEGALYSQDFRFGVDNASPVFGDNENQTVQYLNNFSYSVNATDDFSLSCFGVNDSLFSVDCSGVLTNDSVLNVGIYWINVSANDSVGHESSFVFFVNVTPRSVLGLEFVYPLSDIVVAQNEFFNVSVNVSCLGADCGEVNVTLDPVTDPTTRTCSGVWGASCVGSDPGVGDYSFDGCSAGSYYSSGFWVDEVYVNASVAAIGDVISITCDYDCYSSSDLNDIAIMYYNGTWNKIWRQDDSCIDGNYSVDVVVSGEVGEQYARCSIGYNNYPNDASDDTCFDTTYSDNDDVNFTVVEAGKGGTVSMVVGDTPFYTNVTNPYNLSLNVGESEIVTWWINATGEIGESYEFFAYGNLSSDESINNLTSRWNATIAYDTTMPEVSISYPLEGEYFNYNESIILNYSYSGGVDSCWYSVDGGSNVSIDGCSVFSLNLSEGNRSVGIWVNNSIGIEAFDNVSFVVDLTDPVVGLILPENGSFNYSSNLIDFYYNVSDLNGGFNCSFVLDGEVNRSFDSVGVLGNFSVYLLNGDYNWSVNCSDLASNVGVSEVFVFGVNYSVEVDNSYFDGNSSLFSDRVNASELGAVANLSFERTSYGNLSFPGVVNLSSDISDSVLNFSKYINISFNHIEVNSSALTGLNRSARLSLYGLSFGNPQVLKDGEVCSDCSEVGYSGGVFVFDVGSFSVYSARETPVVASVVSGGGGGGSSRSSRCFVDGDCSEGYSCYESSCVKLFDVEILGVESVVDSLNFSLGYLIKGMADISGDVIVRFWIENESSVFMLGQDAIYLGSFEEKIKMTVLNLPRYVSNGGYELHTQVNFENYSVDSFRHVSVEVSEEDKEVEAEDVEEEPFEVLITGEAVGGSDFEVLWFFVGIGLLVLCLGLFVFLKRKPAKVCSNCIGGSIGKKVYDSEGEEVGEVLDVILEEGRVYGWVVAPSSRYGLEKDVLIEHRYVESVGEVLIVKGNAEDSFISLLEVQRKVCS